MTRGLIPRPGHHYYTSHEETKSTVPLAFNPMLYFIFLFGVALFSTQNWLLVWVSQLFIQNQTEEGDCLALMFLFLRYFLYFWAANICDQTPRSPISVTVNCNQSPSQNHTMLANLLPYRFADFFLPLVFNTLQAGSIIMQELFGHAGCLALEAAVSVCLLVIPSFWFRLKHLNS